MPAVAVVDTVGSGDAFGGAFLARWMERVPGPGRTGRRGRRGEAVTRAIEVASLTCQRRRRRPAHTYRGRLARPLTVPRSRDDGYPVDHAPPQATPRAHPPGVPGVGRDGARCLRADRPLSRRRASANRGLRRAGDPGDADLPRLPDDLRRRVRDGDPGRGVQGVPGQTTAWPDRASWTTSPGTGCSRRSGRAASGCRSGSCSDSSSRRCGRPCRSTASSGRRRRPPSSPSRSTSASIATGTVGLQTWRWLLWHYDRPSFNTTTLCDYSVGNGLANWGTGAAIAQVEAAAKVVAAAGIRARRHRRHRAGARRRHPRPYDHDWASTWTSA